MATTIRDGRFYEWTCDQCGQESTVYWLFFDEAQASLEGHTITHHEHSMEVTC
jgi:hypothetical protein